MKITQFALLCLLPLKSIAAGVLPETTVVIVNEESGSGTIKVQNTDDKNILLYSRLVDIKDDPEPKLHVAQPVTRLEPGQKQVIKFYLDSNLPLRVEHLKRVIFEAIPENSELKSSKVNFIVNQDLPIIIVPKHLADDAEQWNDLKWYHGTGEIRVTNTGKHVIRLNQAASLEPQHEQVKLPKTYILPNQTFHISTKYENYNKILINPVSRYGYFKGTVEMPIVH